MSTYIPAELIDDLTEVYVEWCEECVALRNAYERWAHGPVGEREQAVITVSHRPRSPADQSMAV